MGPTAILLAAGRGTRLRPLTERLPKPAVPILDLPAATFPLQGLRDAGLPVIMNLGPDHVLAEGELAGYLSGVEVVVEEPEPYGSAGTLRALRDRLGGVVVTRNADHLSDLRIEDLLATHDRSRARATIAVSAVDEGADIALGPRGDPAFVDRRAEPRRAGFVWIGAAVFEPGSIALIPDRRPLDLATGLVGPLIARREVALHVHDGYQLDIGTLARYLQSNIDVAHEVIPTPSPVPGRVVEVDGGRAYVGRGAEVEHESLGPGAIVLSGARVEPGAVVDHALVWRGETVPAGTSVRDSIWFGGRELPAT